jgi:hypothetical protein
VIGSDIYYSVPLGTEIYEIKKPNPDSNKIQHVCEDNMCIDNIGRRSKDKSG